MKTSNMNISKDDAMQIPLVSICSITYNHAPYIRQCLDGFLMQRTNFKYEIIIHDDASTDGTAEIIKEYAEKYPDLIIPILQTENQYSKGLRGFYARFVFPRAKGRYIALCEGDDYWTDPLKLQKQVDFLEANPEYVMCSHKVKIFSNIANSIVGEFPKVYDTDFTYDLAFHINKWTTQPLSIVFRYRALDKGYYVKYKNAKDVTLIYTLLKKGNGYCINDCMGVYRIHENGVWSCVSKEDRLKQNLLTLEGIYDAEFTLMSAMYIYNCLSGVRRLKHSFYKENWNLYIKCIGIIIRHLGIVRAMKVLIKNLI